MQEALLSQFKSSIPRLSSSLYKGQLGKIGIFGGCFEYTGAPYFAASSAIRVGADLSYVFCCESAGNSIKSYSPDLIVVPALMTEFEAKKALGLKYYDTIQPSQMLTIRNYIIEKIKVWFEKLDAFVIGPGMGRDELVVDCALEIIKIARNLNKVIVLDGDGLWATRDRPELISNYQNMVLTPNVVEYSRLVKNVLDLDINSKGDPVDTKTFSQISELIKQNKNCLLTVSEYVLKNLAENLGNVTVLKKGNIDVISNGETTVECRSMGGLKRCGGQGDILAGILATLLAWTSPQITPSCDKSQTIKNNENFVFSKPILAAWGASLITKESSKRAFEALGRSLTASEILQQIGSSFNDLCEHHSHQYF